MSNSPLVISNIPVRQDAEGRYCLNDLHKAAGNNPKNKPYNFSRLSTTKGLQAEIEKGSDVGSLNKVQGTGGGTYACKELVYAYAMWISPLFSLKVIRAYDSSVSEQINEKLPITLDSSKGIPLTKPYRALPPTNNTDFYTAISRLAHLKSWAKNNHSNVMVDDIETVERCIKACDKTLSLIAESAEFLTNWNTK